MRARIIRTCLRANFAIAALSCFTCGSLALVLVYACPTPCAKDHMMAPFLLLLAALL